LATIKAGINWGGFELYGVQLVDDAHVPHAADKAYFLDRYGNRQNSMSVNTGEQGALVVEFPGVDPRVATAQFQRGESLAGPVAVSTPPPTQVVNSPMTSQAVPTSLSLPGGQGMPQQPVQNMPQQPVAIQQPAAGYPPPVQNMPQQAGQQQPVAYQQQPGAYPVQSGYQQQPGAYPQNAYQQQYGYRPPEKDAATKAAEKAAAMQQKAASTAAVVNSAASAAQGAASMFNTFKGMMSSGNAAQSTQAAQQNTQGGQSQ